MRPLFVLVGVVLLGACARGEAGPPAVEPAELVISNVVVWTGVEGAGTADALAVRGGRVAAVGSSHEISRYVGPGTRVIDGGRGLVLPGSVDRGVHLAGGDLGLTPAQLRRAPSPHELVAHLRTFQPELTGTLEPGGPADLVVIDSDLLRTRPARLRSARVTHSVVGGRVVFQGEPR